MSSGRVVAVPSWARRAIVVACAVCVWSDGATTQSTGASAASGVRAVYLRLDFDAGQNVFEPADSSQVELVADPTQALAGRSLRVGRVRDGGSLGAGMPLQVKGASELRIAFLVRSRAMREVAVNVFDERRQDNTTPMSPARIFGDDWQVVVFAVENFRHNGGPVDRNISPDTEFASLFFHGRENGPGAEIWIDKLVVYRGHDDRPPDAPSGVRAAAETNGSVELTWQEPADDTFAVVYSIHRKTDAGSWEKVGESLRGSYQDRPPTPGTQTYRITAADFDNNVSPPSADVTVTTAAAVTVDRGADAARSIWAADRTNYAENVRQVHARAAGTVRPDVFLFAGDSLTAATLYTHVLGSWLARGLTVRQGVGQMTTEYGAANIRRYLSEARPEFAILMYGTNDQIYGNSVSGAMRNLAAVVDASLEFGTIPVLATIPPRGFNKRRQQGQERFNRALAELGREKRVPVSYAFEEIMRHDLKDMLYDGVHLQPEGGNDAAGRALRQTMDQVYYALRDASAGW